MRLFSFLFHPLFLDPSSLLGSLVKTWHLHVQPRQLIQHQNYLTQTTLVHLPSLPTCQLVADGEQWFIFMGSVTNSFLLLHVLTMLFTSLFHLWSTCIVLKADMPLYTYIPHFYHMFYRCLPQGEHQFFTYLKPVVRWLYSLAFH